MRFTFTSAIFVLFAAMLTVFTVEAAAIHRREPLPAASPSVQIEERVDAGSNAGGNYARRLHARDFSREARDFTDTPVEARAEAGGDVGGYLAKRLHSRDFRSIH